MTSPVSANSITEQRSALLRGVGVLDRTALSTRIEHRGPDALDLLHRLTTAELLSMKEGEARQAVFCSEKGRVIGLFTVVRHAADKLLLVIDSLNAARLVESIDRYTIIEDAELRDVSAETVHISLAGPQAASLAASAGIPHERLVPHAWPASMQRIDVITPSEDRGSTLDALVRAGAVLVDSDAWNLVRIELGIPAVDSELDENSNPLEAGLMDLVSFEKGCYIGQEVVARLDTYDKLQRRLVGLRSGTPLPKGANLAAVGRNVGRVTSTATSPAFGPIALAFVRKGHWDPGNVLDSSGIPATVASLPFA